MDARPHEPARQGLHGLVNGLPLMVDPSRRTRGQRPARAALVRPLFVLAIATALVASIVGGLLRAGVAVPLPGGSAWPAQAVVHHAFLMMSAFMGSVIAVERAVAVKHRAAFVAPLLSLLSGLLMLAGWPVPAASLGVAAALAFVAVNLVVLRRQPATHTRLLLAGAVAWLIGNSVMAVGGNGLTAVGVGTHLALPWWFGFLVLTIAAERLEMTRLMRHRRGAAAALALCLAGLLLGAGVHLWSPAWGGALFGLALTGLALWLVVFDIARRTIRAQGLSRYMAACLLLGYAWLGVAGAAWAGLSWGLDTGLPLRDMALHALGLGFVFSMMLAHAPVILPAVAGIKVAFGVFFYVPLALLQASLALRLFAAPWLSASLGVLGNTLAIALFALTMGGAALVWRRHHAAPAPRPGPRAGGGRRPRP